MKKNVFFYIVLFGFLFYGYGQIPVITILPPSTGNEIDSVSPHILKGDFHIDSIYDMGDAYLITVVSMDSITTNSHGLSSIAKSGVPFTVISFKNENETNNEAIDDIICVGVVYRHTLSPPEGVWTIFGCKMDDWGYSQSAKDPKGKIIKVPLPLIKTQLMISNELKGLHYFKSGLQ